MKRFWIRHLHSPCKGSVSRLSDLNNEDSHFTPVHAAGASEAALGYAAANPDLPHDLTLAVKEMPDSAGFHDWPDEGPEGWRFIQCVPTVMWFATEKKPEPEPEQCKCGCKCGCKR